MYGTPWHGEGKFASPHGCPLDKIYFIRHANENRIRKTGEIEAISRLLTYSFPPYWDKRGMRFILDFLTDLGTSVPCRQLGFHPDRGIIPFIRSID